MKTITTKAVALATLLFAQFTASYSQNSVPFKARFQSTIKGDMTVIANSIINRIDYDNKAIVPYQNTTSSSLLNDDFMMGYIDVDNDESTFSSSKAELNLINPSNKKIVHAGLYWSATYKYNSGTSKKEGKFSPIDEKREAFNSVKIKLPNQDTYVDVSGEIVYDGLNSKEYKDSAPYVAYADVTSLINEQGNPNGIYTIANVRATEGMIDGGSTAGWTLFVVYEDNTMTEKFISSYDGFSGLTKSPTEVKVTGFEAMQKGNIKAKIACAALEGDTNLLNDQFMFTSGDKKEPFVLKTKTRKDYNFFNSSITNEDAYVTNRFPDSKNTLGYDTFIMTVPNVNNAVIANSTKNATLRFQTTGDKCFVFFTAFNVETQNNQDFASVSTSKVVASNNRKKNSLKSNVKDGGSSKVMVADVDKTLLAKKATDKDYLISTNLMSRVNEKVEIFTENIVDQSSNYYIIANVFSVPVLAQNFINELKAKGIEANYFVNPLNDFRYVYLSKLHSEDEALTAYMSKVNETYKDKIWILSVNNDVKNNNSTITDND